MDYLFQCAIGPVQEFIATARRSRDLWYGSWLLSELSKAAAKTIADGDGRLIFPSTVDIAGDLAARSKFNAPNKIVAVIDGAPDDMAKAVEEAITERLHELRDDAFKKPQTHAYFEGTLAAQQVDDLVEFYWVSVEFAGDYAAARLKGEALLNARKATRNFGRVNGDYKPKSSLDGARESVIDEKAYVAPDDSDAEKEKKAKTLFERFGARPAERLSGVDILKRLGESGRSASTFPSTSHMAALPFLKHIDDNKKAGNSSQLLGAIKQLLDDENIPSDEVDGALVFPSRLAEWVPQKDKRERIGKEIETLLGTYAGDTRPQPYYALLAADGDNMGAAIDHLTSLPSPQDEHRKLSVALSKFATDVEGIVIKHEGALVYSGGDDVLAYLPLHTVLPCADELAERFKSTMAGFTTAQGVAPTLSTGIVVAHHLEPLSDTLDLARNAERIAKTVDGKHGLAITVSKRSGVDRTIKGERTDLKKRLDTMICWQRAGVISAGTPYELQKLYQVLGQSEALQDAMIKEALRIIERKRESGGDFLDEKKQKAILRQFKTWLDVKQIPLLEVAHEMIIANGFASAMDVAGVAKEECFPS